MSPTEMKLFEKKLSPLGVIFKGVPIVPMSPFPMVKSSGGSAMAQIDENQGSEGVQTPGGGKRKSIAVGKASIATAEWNFSDDFHHITHVLPEGCLPGQNLLVYRDFDGQIVGFYTVVPEDGTPGRVYSSFDVGQPSGLKTVVAPGATAAPAAVNQLALQPEGNLPGPMIQQPSQYQPAADYQAAAANPPAIHQPALLYDGLPRYWDPREDQAVQTQQTWPYEIQPYQDAANQIQPQQFDPVAKSRVIILAVAECILFSLMSYACSLDLRRLSSELTSWDIAAPYMDMSFHLIFIALIVILWRQWWPTMRLAPPHRLMRRWQWFLLILVWLALCVDSMLLKQVGRSPKAAVAYSFSKTTFWCCLECIPLVIASQPRVDFLDAWGALLDCLEI